MSVFLIYIPPVIFLAALIWLVVILGKKTAALKGPGADMAKKETFAAGEKSGAKLKEFWKHVLGFTEKFLRLVKAGARKMEMGLSSVMHKMKEKRLGRKLPKPTLDGESKMEYFREDSGVFGEENKRRKIVGSETPRGNAAFLQKEVVVRKKEEPIPQRIVPETAPEDRKREEALIHRIAENPKDIEAYRELGDYYLSVGNVKDSKDSFKMVLKLRPRDLKAKSSLREIEMKMRLGN